jgi:hypothetical protein
MIRNGTNSGKSGGFKPIKPIFEKWTTKDPENLIFNY